MMECAYHSASEFDPHARVQIRISLVYAFGTTDSWVSVTTCVVFVFTDLLSFLSFVLLFTWPQKRLIVVVLLSCIS